MITVTFIRHGESEDNLRTVWAGWKDAPLSALGRKQAEAVAKYFADTKFDYIYASPLLRAYATGKAVHEAQPLRPPFSVNPKLREQHFGIAEGNPWLLEIPEGVTAEELMAKNIFPVLPTRADGFPEGESLEDLARRAEEAIAECVLPHIGEDGAHIAVASHGLCISELIAALLRLDPYSRRDISYTGLLNTAWTRLTIAQRSPDDPCALQVTVTDVNRSDHLATVEIPEVPVAVDEDARAFFGGGGKPVADVPVTNARV
ncbi:putative histidine phosphatase superfamily (branch 1) [Lyophyllum shimeji]|uniref:Histidine phosphatase superfamily (Branch 1) n=1 Tax=Lyophyllum shimeji TaxID=47721 RepID=A0A9P3PSS7_LYOSH|nr:putative histidine phosphatase superfamily (branch 1) [Lyophyllum shimeji]